MDSVETAQPKTRFSLLTLIILAALVVIAFNQYAQNRKMQRRLETLSFEIKELEAYAEDMRAKQELLIDHVRDTPVLSVGDVPVLKLPLASD